jgi:hypothetical protein
MPEDENGDERDAVIDALFASDLARDVRSEFNARRDEGMSVHDATSTIVASYGHVLARPEEGPVVIIALAALQLLERAPISTFRDAALDLLREGHGFAVHAGENRTFRRDRERFRTQLIAMLEAPIVDAPDESGMSGM